MTDNDVFDAGQARSALESAERAQAAGRDAARRWARRYLLGFGAVAAGSVLVVWALTPWVSSAWWGVWYGALVAVFAIWLRRQPVRALPRRTQFVTILVWSIVFGATMGIGIDNPVAYPIGAVAGFAVWASAAWWVGR